jgi:hypothetical protein
VRSYIPDEPRPLDGLQAPSHPSTGLLLLHARELATDLAFYITQLHVHLSYPPYSGLNANILEASQRNGFVHELHYHCRLHSAMKILCVPSVHIKTAERGRERENETMVAWKEGLDWPLRKRPTVVVMGCCQVLCCIH